MPPHIKHNLRIVYMGTPDFAVAPLKRLVEGGYQVVAVVTMPDKAVGRHQSTLQASPVKQYAVSQGLPVLQPEKLRDEQFLQALAAFDADLQIVVAFRMLPEVVWAMPRLGTFNLHASLLPQYRGAAPINWAIINGEKETGVTTFFLDKEIDTGKIIDSRRIEIEETDTAGTLHDRMMGVGADLVCDTVDQILAETVKPVAQDTLHDADLKPAPKIFKETCRIDWQQPLEKVYDFVRGLSPYPAAWTELHHAKGVTVIKIYDTHKDFCTPTEPIGSLVTEGRKVIKVALKDGYLHLDSLQIAGKKRMTAADFLCGFHADGTEHLV